MFGRFGLCVCLLVGVGVTVPAWGQKAGQADELQQSLEQQVERYHELQRKLVEQLIADAGPDGSMASEQLDAIFRRHAPHVLARQPMELVEQLRSVNPMEVKIALEAWGIARRNDEDPVPDGERAVKLAGGILTRFKDQIQTSGSPWQLDQKTPLFRMAKEVMERHPEHAVAWLDANWADEIMYVSMVGYLGEKGGLFADRMLPLLQSDNSELRAVAAYTMDRVLREQAAAINRKRAEVKRLAEREQAIEEKFLAYATRLVERNDANGNGALDKEESEEMISDPSPADTDGDGRVTIKEFASWLMSRARTDEEALQTTTQ